MWMTTYISKVDIFSISMLQSDDLISDKMSGRGEIIKFAFLLLYQWDRKAHYSVESSQIEFLNFVLINFKFIFQVTI